MISSEKHSPSLLDHRLPLRWGVPLLLLLVLLPFAAEALGEGFYIGVASRILIFALAATSLNLSLALAAWSVSGMRPSSASAPTPWAS